MHRFVAGVLALGAGLLLVIPAGSQPPQDRGRDQKDGPPRQGPDGPPPRFEPGRILPPPLVRELNLTRAQQEKLAKLEKEVKQKLLKILTSEQKRKLEEMRRNPPRRPPQDGPPRRDDDRPPPPPSEKEAMNHSGQGGIQWFATWESGLREARRTQRPILLVSAAPHCAGVSGIW